MAGNGEGEGVSRPGSERAGGGKDMCPFCGSAVDEERVRIGGGRGRVLQVVRTGGRKYFGRQRKELFLGWFAATANVAFAAAQAGVCRQTVSKHRLSDPGFEAKYRQAVELAVPDLQARLHAFLNGRPELGLDGGLELPDEEEFDPQLALQILREQQRMMAAGPGGPGQARKQGRRPRVATNAEVKAALVKALRAFGERVAAEEEGKE